MALILYINNDIDIKKINNYTVIIRRGDNFKRGESMTPEGKQQLCDFLEYIASVQFFFMNAPDFGLALAELKSEISPNNCPNNKKAKIFLVDGGKKSISDQT